MNNKKQKDRQILKTIKLISKYLGKTKAVVSHRNPFRVLISTIISQRTRDEITNKISKKFFSKYKNVKQLSKAPLREIEKIIYGCGFYRNKAKAIKKISKILVEKYRGKVPRTFEELVSLPGVGRKTANCVLVYAFGEPTICVDIHTHRIPQRLGWFKSKTPEQTESKLKSLIPKKYWLQINELFVKFGQRCCKPLRPLCNKCPVAAFCKYREKFSG